MASLRAVQKLFGLTIWIAVSLLACREAAPTAGAGGSPAAGGSTGSAGAAAGGGGSTAAPTLPDVLIGSWNLHNFSKYGDKEFRLSDIAAKVDALAADVLTVQELKVAEGTAGEPPQAFDALLAALPNHLGTHNPWNSFDSTVGVIYDTRTTSVLDQSTLFEGDSYAFPRPPLEVRVEVSKQGASTELSLIVLHLKAFGDSVDRRRDACKKLVAYLDGKSQPAYLVIGDLNDDPYDPAASNSFTGTFLDNEPAYYFLTAQLPPESVSSLGYYHYVDGKKITGEFLDHAIATEALFNRFATVTPSIDALPESQFDSYESDYSDHFPLLVSFTP